MEQLKGVLLDATKSMGKKAASRAVSRLTSTARRAASPSAADASLELSHQPVSKAASRLVSAARNAALLELLRYNQPLSNSLTQALRGATSTPGSPHIGRSFNI